VVAEQADDTAVGDFADPSAEPLPTGASREGAQAGETEALRPEDQPPSDEPGEAADVDEPVDAGVDAGADAG
jgi:hypothetical protein